MKAQFKKGESDLLIIIERVLNNMENNAVFPNPPAILADLKKLQPELATALANAEGRDKKMVSIKNDKKAAALDLLQQLADFVTAISKGDRTMILESGFEVSSEGRASSPPPSIGELEVELGPSGEATIRTKNVTGVKAYIHQYATEQPGLNTVWTGEGSSEGVHTFTGLTSEKRAWFRVIAIGYNRQRSISPVVSKVIQ
jgi:hypothetical protein